MERKLFLIRLAVLIWGIFAFIILTACKTNADVETHYVVKDWDKNWEKYKIRENIITQNLVEEMGIGINLGNTLEACGDWIDNSNSNIDNYIKAWGSPVPTEEMIAGYANAGFYSLRIPVAWSNMMQPDGYIIHPDLFEMVENVVNWTIDNGMVALINLHWDGGWWKDFPTKHDEVLKKYVAIWTQICERFESYGDRLMFENMNEVGFDDIWTTWRGGNKKRAFDLVNELNQVFVDTVRASGGNNEGRHLLINVYNTGLEYAYDPFFKLPDDPAKRMALSVHYYTPAVFAILDKDADWGKARTTWGNAADLKELNDNMNLLKRNCVDKGIPVIIGEFAACGDNKTPAMKHLYALSVMEAVYSRGMCPMLWDTPGGEYDRYEYYLWSAQFEEAIQNFAVRK